MAQLPSGNYLVQNIGSDVVIFERDTERELVRFNVNDREAVVRAQKEIHDELSLNAEDKVFAHFWSGYFYAHLTTWAKVND